MSIPRLRPAQAEDVDAIVAFARTAAVGVTTLQPDPDYLAQRIARSTVAFAHTPPRPGGDEYLFVVDHDGEIVACSAIVARVGGHDPFYTYEVRHEHHAYEPLGVDRTVDALYLKRDHKGPSEVCGLAVAPDRRGQGIGRVASLGRLMFVAAFPERFAERTIAEIRGFQDDAGRSPFWEAVGSVFFAPNGFEALDVMSGLGDKDFIAELMPEHPIYLDLLSADVRASVGRPHRDAVGAVRLLTEQGFRPADEVDIFDAGPILECATRDITIVRQARSLPVVAVGPTEGGVDCLVASVGADFNVIAASPVITEEGAVLAPAAAQALAVDVGSTVLVEARSQQ